MVAEYLNNLPLATFVVWSVIVGTQLARRRIRTLTEVSFVIGSFSWAGYALADWVFFHAPDAATATLWAAISVTFVTLATFFLLFFSKLFLTRTDKWDLLLIAPFGFALVLVWGGMVQGARPAWWGWQGIFDPAIFLVWLVFVITYAMVAVWYIYRTYLVVREDSQFLGRRLFGIFISLLLTFVLGIGTNTVFETMGIGLMPLFSSLLVAPGLITLYVLVPMGKQRISSAMGRWKSTRYETLGVFLIYENGTLIASKTAIQDQKVDDDIFGATLDAIQTFMRTSFPLLIGKWLRRIEHGDVKILIERGRYSYIAVVIRGEDPDTLWIKMKEAVQRFEARNVARLVDWNGVTDDLSVVAETLEGMFADRAVFS